MDLFNVAIRYRKFIFQCTLVATIVTTAFSIFVPDWYKSTTSIFPVEESIFLTSLGSVSSPIKSFSGTQRISYTRSLSRLLASGEMERYVAILKSNTVLLDVIRKFNLTNVYGITSDSLENTIKELLENVEFKIVWEGNMYVTVYDKDPRRASDMANYFVEILNQINSEMLAQTVRGNRQFIEKCYHDNVDNLSEAEDSLKSFQERSGVVALPEQTQAYIKTVTDLTGRLTAEELRASVMRKALSFDHPFVKQMELRIEALRNKLTEVGSEQHLSEDDLNLFSPFNKYRTFGFEYYRRFRDVEVRSAILQFSALMYEQAKAEEQRKASAVVVLDYATPSEEKSGPYKILIILGGALAGGLSALSFSLLYEKWVLMKNRLLVSRDSF